MRLVDADKLSKKLVKLIECEETVYPRKAIWVGESQLHRVFVARCSKCGKLAAIDSFCGCCGAQMEKTEEYPEW